MKMKLFLALTIATSLTACGRMPEEELAAKQALSRETVVNAQELVDSLVFVQRSGSNLCFMVRPEHRGSMNQLWSSSVVVHVPCTAVLQ